MLFAPLLNMHLLNAGAGHVKWPPIGAQKVAKNQDQKPCINQLHKHYYSSDKQPVSSPFAYLLLWVKLNIELIYQDLRLINLADFPDKQRNANKLGQGVDVVRRT